jgi:hypothetical protein
MLNKSGIVNIIWSEIDSSSISYMHYHNDGSKGLLGVIFKSGQSYIYNDVPMFDILSVLKSESVGSAFTKEIKLRYPYKNIGIINSGSPLEKIGIRL